MRKMRVVVTGLLCFVARETHSQSFEQRVLQISREVSKAQAVAVQGCGEGCGSQALNPADALDETKVGIAAKFIALKPGEFEMGSPGDEAHRVEDESLHAVKLTKGFEMQATAVTQLQYFLVMGRNPSDSISQDEDCDRRTSTFKVVAGVGLCVNRPVDNVSWDDAQAFIARMNKIQSEHIYRLPTEAEWEYAARAGVPSSFPYSFGFNDKNQLDNYAWYAGNSGGRTHAVATKRANPWGLYDIYGNVWQWVNDWYGDYPSSAVQDPPGPATGNDRVMRGGCYLFSPYFVRSAARFSMNPDARWIIMGFRLVRSSR